MCIISEPKRMLVAYRETFIKNINANLATGEDTGEYLEKYTYSYPVWRCKRNVGERDGEPPKNGSPDQKAYCRSKKGCMEKLKAVDGRCLIECASVELMSFIEDAYRCLKSR